MRDIGGNLFFLQSLDVSYCRKLTDLGLEAVAEGCPDLQRLYLEGCRFVTDKLLLSISHNCRKLKELGLQGCNNVTDQGISDLVDRCHKVEFLDINKCSNIGDLGVSRVAECCSFSLRTLKLLDCYRAGDQSIFSLAKYCKNLENLIIGGCRDVSDEPLKCLAAACGDSLKYLRMDWCLNITDSSLKCILTQCGQLEALDIGCCEEVTDAAFEVLDGDGKQLKLKFLKVGNCPNVTVRAIGLILAKCSFLKYLDVRSCPRISKAACDEAGLLFPELCKVNFCGSLSEPDVIL
ncbi:hypothetical protein MLD38_024279 [Melastoma candidum]|nr:hypothetical protein MLD38_024279 [Melastoma candidum]